MTGGRIMRKQFMELEKKDKFLLLGGIFIFIGCDFYALSSKGHLFSRINLLDNIFIIILIISCFEGIRRGFEIVFLLARNLRKSVSIIMTNNDSDGRYKTGKGNVKYK
jgi:hypothetical protein